MSNDNITSIVMNRSADPRSERASVTYAIYSDATVVESQTVFSIFGALSRTLKDIVCRKFSTDIYMVTEPTLKTIENFAYGKLGDSITLYRSASIQSNQQRQM